MHLRSFVLELLFRELILGRSIEDELAGVERNLYLGGEYSKPPSKIQHLTPRK